jgi:hypothetical protein
MTLKVREGWKIEKMYNPYRKGHERIYREGESWGHAYALIESKGIYVYPNGGMNDFEFDSIEEAHAYLLSVGSESPWEEVC